MMASMCRELSFAGAGPMSTASSASATCMALRSASENTATVRRPMRLAVRMIRQAISPRLAINSLSKGRPVDTSHPEDAEAGRLGRRRVEAGREREAEHRAGVGRVDHAVVPQPRGGVIGMALLLVLLADRRLERPVVGRAPAPALALAPCLT